MYYRAYDIINLFKVKYYIICFSFIISYSNLNLVYAKTADQMNTCTPTHYNAFVPFGINLISFGMYYDVMNKIFMKKNPQSQTNTTECLRINRAHCNKWHLGKCKDAKINFLICNNETECTEYNNISIDAELPNIAGAKILGFIPINYSLKVKQDLDVICIYTNIYGTWYPVGCKSIEEPFKNSIYNDDFVTECTGTRACSYYATKHSKAYIPMTGVVITCINQLINKLLYTVDLCRVTGNSSYIIDKDNRDKSVLFQFQDKMRLTVKSLLTIYIIFLGFKILLQAETNKTELIIAVLKIILVSYFSIGIASHADDKTQILSGITSWIMPFFIGGINQLSTWLIDTNTSSLCNMLPSEYDAAYRYLAIWDYIDCHIAHYLGLDMIINLTSAHTIDIPPYIYLVLILVIAQQWSWVLIVLAYPIFIISLGLLILEITVRSMLSITMLAITAPIFIPMSLFKTTEKYFNNWIKNLFSLMLQPMIVTIISVLFFSINDYAFYGSCKYKTNNIEVNDGRVVKIPSLDIDFEDSYYKSNPNNMIKCQTSIGYILKMLSSPAQGIMNIITMVQNNTGINISFVQIISSMIASMTVLYVLFNAAEELPNYVANLSMSLPLVKFRRYRPKMQRKSNKNNPIKKHSNDKIYQSKKSSNDAVYSNRKFSNDAVYSNRKFSNDMISKKDKT
ncbi:TrbL/VirB6 family protein [Rickettsia endosymbiont of Cardiosporidium cionae]|uniref:type IV secretion system protein n=1 Tax=Rickettsia endosymbiont of Cardiosporidium cionae TaxID=2777155 RepID=UPI001893AAE9|nr:type IV secretion system protein [Rickettsia endosymbiont of Cardiosporidium cionae]KAF8818858.1 hypothetical protein IHI24_000092 [Rickettsia endosymbiont of Cardiosporidium cionae]